jgi:DNA recombination protein RmuC
MFPVFWTEIISFAIALIAGVALAWYLGVQRGRQQGHTEYEQKVAEAEGRFRESERERARQDALASERAMQAVAARRETDELRAQMAEADRARVSAETTALETQKNLEEQRGLVEQMREHMKDTFKALAGEALSENQKQFVELAQSRFEQLQTAASGELSRREEAIRGIVDPLNRSLEKLSDEIGKVEASRQFAYGELTRQVEDLKKETGSLVTSLRQPQVKGRWGELTLRRAVELAGMNAHVDFEEQQSYDTSEGGRMRPDMTIHLPGGRKIVVDAKVPLHAYARMESIQTNEEFYKILDEHARLVRGHVERLASRAYWSELPDATDFVVLFLPGENFFSGALQKDPSLIADATDRRVILASPTTLIALLRAVDYGWRQQELAENAQRISQLGKELYERILKFAEHMESIRSGLEKANKSYNNAVGSFDHMLLPGAKKFRELGVQTSAEIADLEPTETSLRALASRDEEDS